MHILKTFKHMANMSPLTPQTSSSAGPSQDDVCPICLEPFDNLAIGQPCAHSFCLACILHWLEAPDQAAYQECPLCRDGFTEIRHSFDAEGNSEVHALPMTKDGRQREVFQLQEARLRRLPERKARGSGTMFKFSVIEGDRKVSVEEKIKVEMEQRDVHTITRCVHFMNFIWTPVDPAQYRGYPFADSSSPTFKAFKIIEREAEKLVTKYAKDSAITKTTINFADIHQRKDFGNGLIRCSLKEELRIEKSALPEKISIEIEREMKEQAICPGIDLPLPMGTNEIEDFKRGETAVRYCIQWLLSGNSEVLSQIDRRTTNLLRRMIVSPACKLCNRQHRNGHEVCPEVRNEGAGIGEPFHSF